MKNQLIKNQIDYYLKDIKIKMDIFKKDNPDLNPIYINHTISMYNGMINALSISESDNLEYIILDSISMYRKALSDIKIDFLNKNDKNYDIFYLIKGAINILMLLITVPGNPLSSCPINREYLLNLSLIKLKEDLKEAIEVKNNKLIKEIKGNIKYTEEMYKEVILCI